jgi:tetratricopeptide (TPR) repeat protein
MTTHCGEDELRSLVQAMQSDQSDQVERLDAVLSRFPEDARLHFMRGSVLAGQGRLIEAHHALTRAVELAPDFAIARFQLGFFQLTSGEANNALATWGRLDRLPEGHYLRKFVDGLRCLIRDEFDNAIRLLRDGIALNDENLPLSGDMKLIIDQCLTLTAKLDASGAASETSLILSQLSGRRT